jgi:hypothetical protein
VLPEDWPDAVGLGLFGVGTSYDDQFEALDENARQVTNAEGLLVGLVTPSELGRYADERAMRPDRVVGDYIEEVAALGMYRPSCGALLATQLRLQRALTDHPDVDAPLLEAAEDQASDVLEELTRIAVAEPTTVEVRFDEGAQPVWFLLDLARSREPETVAAVDTIHSSTMFAGVVGGAVRARQETGRAWDRDLGLAGSMASGRSADVTFG